MNTETITWLPIDTAPKDREVLLWFPQRHEAHYGQWNTESYHRAWAIVSIHGARHIKATQPTHWAELPKGPQFK